MNPQASGLLRRFAINRNTSRGKGKGHSFSESVSGFLICSPAYNDFIVLQLQAAHSLKGSSGMLGLSGLFEAMKSVTEPLRRGDASEAAAYRADVEREYAAAIGMIKSL